MRLDTQPHGTRPNDLVTAKGVNPSMKSIVVAWRKETGNSWSLARVTKRLKHAVRPETENGLYGGI